MSAGESKRRSSARRRPKIENDGARETAIALLCPPQTHLPRAVRSGPRLLPVHSLADLLRELETQSRPLVLIDPQALQEAEIELASRLRDLPCRPSVAVWGRERFMDLAVSTARRLDLGQVLPEDCLDHPEELARWIPWIEAGGPEPGAATHLEPGATIEKFSLHTCDDKARIINAVLQRLQSVRPDRSFLFDVRLVLEEALNNALYHAFLDADRREKYGIGTFTQTGPGEEIDVQLGIDGRSVALSVADNQGVLSRDVILAKLERQMNAAGLLDQNGRGLYLAYSLSDRLLFNLHRSRVTEVVTLFFLGDPPQVTGSRLKPVLVFERG